MKRLGLILGCVFLFLAIGISIEIVIENVPRDLGVAYNRWMAVLMHWTLAAAFLLVYATEHAREEVDRLKDIITGLHEQLNIYKKYGKPL